MSLEENLRCYRECIGDLLYDETVLAMRGIRHHFDVTCYEHSVFVSYVAFRLARRWKADCRAAARAGLLHDLYLYNPREPGSHEGLQCFAHPKKALENAARLLEDLSPSEEDSILTHMWPLSKKMPRYKISFIVNLADKICATGEVCRVFRALQRKGRVPVSVVA